MPTFASSSCSLLQKLTSAVTNRFEFFFSVTEVGTAHLIALFVLVAAGVIVLLNLTFSRYFCSYLCPYQMTALAFVNRARHTFHESPKCRSCAAVRTRLPDRSARYPQRV